MDRPVFAAPGNGCATVECGVPPGPKLIRDLAGTGFTLPRTGHDTHLRLLGRFLLTSILGLIATTLAGGLVPLFVTRSHRVLHRFVAFATGLFLGIVFLHLLPESLAAEPGGLPAPWPGALVLAGVIALYVVQHLLLPGQTGSDPHVALGWSSLVGLSVHAFAAGLGLAAVHGDPEVARVLLVSILVHKAAEGFSLAAVFRLSHSSTRRILGLVGLFSLATPIGLLLGGRLLEQMTSTGAQAFTALAAGTFLYVSLGDLLPEVFHGRDDRGIRLALLAAGIGASAAFHMLGA